MKSLLLPALVLLVIGGTAFSQSVSLHSNPAEDIAAGINRVSGEMSRQHEEDKFQVVVLNSEIYKIRAFLENPIYCYATPVSIILAGLNIGYAIRATKKQATPS